MKRIGMLTSGGDCQALNAAMRGVAKTLFNSGEKVEIYGFQDGYQGLIYGRFKLLTYADFTGILTKGGTFLGTSRTPFKTIQIPGEDGVDKVAAMKQTYYKLQLDCLVVLGGNGTHKTANLLRQEGLNVVLLAQLGVLLGDGTLGHRQNGEAAAALVALLDIVKVPLEEVAGKLKMVDPDSSIVKEAKLLGISFGD